MFLITKKRYKSETKRENEEEDRKKTIQELAFLIDKFETDIREYIEAWVLDKTISQEQRKKRQEIEKRILISFDIINQAFLALNEGRLSIEDFNNNERLIMIFSFFERLKSEINIFSFLDTLTKDKYLLNENKEELFKIFSSLMFELNFEYYDLKQLQMANIYLIIELEQYLPKDILTNIEGFLGNFELLEYIYSNSNFNLSRLKLEYNEYYFALQQAIRFSSFKFLQSLTTYREVLPNVINLLLQRSSTDDKIELFGEEFRGLVDNYFIDSYIIKKIASQFNLEDERELIERGLELIRDYLSFFSSTSLEDLLEFDFNKFFKLLNKVNDNEIKSLIKAFVNALIKDLKKRIKDLNKLNENIDKKKDKGILISTLTTDISYLFKSINDLQELRQNSETVLSKGIELFMQLVSEDDLIELLRHINKQITDIDYQQEILPKKQKIKLTTYTNNENLHDLNFGLIHIDSNTDLSRSNLNNSIFSKEQLPYLPEWIKAGLTEKDDYYIFKTETLVEAIKKGKIKDLREVDLIGVINLYKIHLYKKLQDAKFLEEQLPYLPK